MRKLVALILVSVALLGLAGVVHAGRSCSIDEYCYEDE
jgi:hypothetical protein